MKRFVYFHKDGQPSRMVALAVVMSVAALRLVAGRGPFQLRKNGEEGPPRKRVELLRRLRAQLAHGELGDVYQVVDGKDDPIFRVREAKPALKVVDTNGNNKIDVVWSAVKAAFPAISFLGAYVCKSIVGSGGVMSQHSYGNAVDIGAATMADLYRIAHWLVARADELDLEHVIVDDVIWTRGIGWHAYTGERHYHVHTDCDPEFSGHCGVRNAA